MIKPTHKNKNGSTALKKMNCLLVLTHFKSMFHSMHHENLKVEVFQKVWK